MWYACNDHQPNVNKWLRDDSLTRDQISLTSRRTGARSYNVPDTFKTMNSHRRCPTICRLPCSLQPLQEDNVKPRPWLSSEEAWESARREIAERKERIRKQELEFVETARRQLEIEQSEAVRIARTKTLDREVAADWDFQKNQNDKINCDKVESEFQQDVERLVDNENLVKEDKLKAHRDLIRNIDERIDQEKALHKLKTQNSVKLGEKHKEENLESSKIRRELAREAEEDLQRRQEEKEKIGGELLSQIISNRTRREEVESSRKALEALERRRLEQLTEAQRFQMNHEKKLKRKEDDGVKSLISDVKAMKFNQNKSDNFKFLNEGWNIDKDKINQTKQFKEIKKEVNIKCSNFNRGIMEDVIKQENKSESLKLEEMRNRLAWEKDYSGEVNRDQQSQKLKKERYLMDLHKQMSHNITKKQSREKYENDLHINIRDFQTHLDDIDSRECVNPIDKEHPCRF